MAVIQSVYREGPGRGFPGMVANGETSNRISRTCEEAAGIPFGAGVFDGAGDHGCSRNSARAFLGFAIADHGVTPLPGGVAADVYPRYSTVGIMTGGGICVTAGANVNRREPVYVTPDGLTITNVAAANIAAPGWTFDETVATGGVVRVVRR